MVFYCRSCKFIRNSDYTGLLDDPDSTECGCHALQLKRHFDNYRPSNRSNGNRPSGNKFEHEKGGNN